MNIFDTLKKDDTYSALCVMLYAMTDDPNFATLNELVYLTDKNSFLNILKYFEGQTIRIPTMKESKDAFRTLLLHQYYTVEENKWETALEKAEISKDDSTYYKRLLNKFEDKLEEKDYKTGGIKNVIKGLDT